MTTNPIQLAKRAFRKEFKLKLAQQSGDTISKESTLIFQELKEIAYYTKAKNISIFLNSQNEVSTVEIVKNILESGKSCFVPLCVGDEMHMVQVNSYNDVLGLKRNKWDIPEPTVEENRINAFDCGGLDLIIMPGLAVDHSRNRIGYGKGYYDKYLLKSQQFAIECGKQKPVAIAIALSAQIVDQVPIDEYDLKPDLIVTPSGIIQ